MVITAWRFLLNLLSILYIACIGVANDRGGFVAGFFIWFLLGQIRYNFESQQFEETLPNGRIDTVTEADFGELAKSRGARATQAGRTTLKRAVVSASILSGQGQAAWNAVLGNLIRQSGQQLDNPAS